MSARWPVPLLALAALVAAPARAQDNACRAPATLPAAVRPFVERGTCAIALERGDLDRDGRLDYVLVLERTSGPVDPDTDGRRRSLLALTAGANGTLTRAARNDTVVLCSKCGGVFGDPFEGVEVRPGAFTVNHYGGSSWRWRVDFTFGWSRIDRTWQLVRIEEVGYHTSNPDSVKSTTSRPPRDFGKIDLRTFDASRWLERKR
jgi:hypothetical protein